MTAETPSGSLYRKSDIAKAAIPLKGLPISEGKVSQRGKVKSAMKEPKSKLQKKDLEPALETESEEESRILLDEQTKELFQNSDAVVTSKKPYRRRTKFGD